MDSFVFSSGGAVSDGSSGATLYFPTETSIHTISGFITVDGTDPSATVSITIEGGVNFTSDALALADSDNVVSFVFPVPVSAGSPVSYTVNVTGSSGSYSWTIAVNK